MWKRSVLAWNVTAAEASPAYANLTIQIRPHAPTTQPLHSAPTDSAAAYIPQQQPVLRLQTCSHHTHAMTDEESGHGEKTSRRDRWKGALARTKTKLKEHSKKGDKDDFKLSDDVNDFLQAGRPSTSDSGASRSETLSDKLLYPQHDHEHMVQAGLTSHGPAENKNVTPPRALNTAQRSPRGIPIPKIDVTRSQRWPSQQELGPGGVNEFIRPHHHPSQQARSQSQGAIPGLRKGNRPRNLSVAFLEAPPVVIGEGGDEAEAPPREIGRAKARARSASPMPGRGIEGHPQQFGRKHVPTSAGSAGSGASLHSPFVPRLPTRVQTGYQGQYPTSAGSKSSAEMAEFEMSLQAPTPTTASGPKESPSHTPYRDLQSVQPNRIQRPPPTDGPSETEAAHFAQTNYGERHMLPVRPGIANEDLRMQFEEGQALRHSHYRGLSNTSTIGTDVSPVSPDLRQLSLQDSNKKPGVISERRVEPGISPVSPEDGGWI
jgi:hypothetical protein